MKKLIKRIMLFYNIFALPFLPLVMYIHSPKGSFLFSVTRKFYESVGIIFVALFLLFQMYLIPQIFAALLIGLYLYDLLHNRMICPIRRELPVFLILSIWTIFSALCILFGCIPPSDGIGIPLP